MDQSEQIRKSILGDGTYSNNIDRYQDLCLG